MKTLTDACNSASIIKWRNGAMKRIEIFSQVRSFENRT